MGKLARFATLVTCAAALAVPLIGSAQTPEVSERIRQVIRRVKAEAKHLSTALGEGEGYDQTQSGRRS